MSIDFYYKPLGNKITKDFLTEKLSDSYTIIDIKTNEVGDVTYFTVNPKDIAHILYGDVGYEFHLQDDGRYWHPILTRDDNEFDIENEVIDDISTSIDLDLETD